MTELLILSLRKNLSEQYCFPEIIRNWDKDHWLEFMLLIDETIEEHSCYEVMTKQTVIVSHSPIKYATKCRIYNMTFSRQLIHPNKGDMHWSSVKILKEALGVYDKRISRRTENLFSLLLIGDGFSEFRKRVQIIMRELNMAYSSESKLKANKNFLDVMYQKLKSR